MLGAGVFGLYAAAHLAGRGNRVAVVDYERRPLMRASLINQARIHNGYHYPRSVFTALQAAQYYERFVRDFPQAVNGAFRKVYAIAAAGSYTDAAHFRKFCDDIGAPAREVDPGPWFRPGSVEAAFETEELSFDAATLRASLVARVADSDRVTWLLGRQPARVRLVSDVWDVELDDGTTVRAPRAVNATYAGTNHVLELFGAPPLSLKYELCELSLVSVRPELAGVGLTVMDGPFFSLMPFGHSGLHSLSAVDHTPRRWSNDDLPTFSCQQENPACSPQGLDNCSGCPVRPVPAHAYMTQLAGKFIHTEGLQLRDTIHAVKTILDTSEVDDARPTLIMTHAPGPELITVLSGKINTIYDLEEVL